MGFFNKKKNSDNSASVLSESEIQKKLYGEFSTGGPHVVIGERDHFREPSPSSGLASVETSPEIEKDPDLFSAHHESHVEPDLPPRSISQEQKTTDAVPRYVPLQNFERKSIPASPATSASDPYARFRYNRPPENKKAWYSDVLLPLFSGAAELVRKLLDPKQVVVRRFLYWGVAVLAVFLLFWGVNVLNTQREEALRARYKIPHESASAPVQTVSSETPVVAREPVAERPVVITPAPVRPKKIRASEGGGAAGVLPTTSYVIQVVTYPTRQDAEQVVATFKKAGLQAYVKENTRPSGRTFFVVHLGGFRTVAEAQAQLLKFRAMEVARPFQDAFVKTSRS